MRVSRFGVKASSLTRASYAPHTTTPKPKASRALLRLTCLLARFLALVARAAGLPGDQASRLPSVSILTCAHLHVSLGSTSPEPCVLSPVANCHLAWLPHSRVQLSDPPCHTSSRKVWRQGSLGPYFFFVLVFVLVFVLFHGATPGPARLTTLDWTLDIFSSLPGILSGFDFYRSPCALIIPRSRSTRGPGARTRTLPRLPSPQT